MPIRYCLPIQKQTIEAVCKAARPTTAFDFIEVWLSCIQNIKIEDIRWLMKNFPKKLILVLRAKRGQRETLSDAQKIEILRLAADLRIIVDLDLGRECLILEHMKRENIHAKLILSHHNFSRTPSIQALRGIVRRMEVWSPTIYKIACFCRTPCDAMVLLKLTLELRKENKPCIVLGMGPMGTATRIFGTLWGNEMIFAPKARAQSSAPGQLTKRQLEIIFSALGGI